MKYHFSLERKTLVWFGLGFTLMGLFVFADGVLAGMGLYRHSVLPIMLAQQRQSLTSSAATAEARNHPAAAAPSSTTTGTVATASGTTPAASAANAAAPAGPAAASSAVDTAASLAAACGIPQPAAAPASAQSGFALQLGAFQSAANASRLVTDLKGRGCTAQVIQMTDAHQQVWNVVRIGPYSSLAAAAKAAADAQRAQGLLALIRPAHSI